MYLLVDYSTIGNNVLSCKTASSICIAIYDGSSIGSPLPSCFFSNQFKYTECSWSLTRCISHSLHSPFDHFDCISTHFYHIINTYNTSIGNTGFEANILPRMALKRCWGVNNAPPEFTQCDTRCGGVMNNLTTVTHRAAMNCRQGHIRTLVTGNPVLLARSWRGKPSQFLVSFQKRCDSHDQL